MENASKALLIAAEMLIAVLIVTMGVTLFSSMSEYSEKYNKKLQTQDIQSFNTQFLANTDDITAQDIITAKNLANSWNEQNGYDIDDTADSEYSISIYTQGDGLINKWTETQEQNFLNTSYNYSTPITQKKYEIYETKYSQITGKVVEIRYKEI